jgi:thioredoxin-like negative regulator of GroEL
MLFFFFSLILVASFPLESTAFVPTSKNHRHVNPLQMTATHNPVTSERYAPPLPLPPPTIKAKRPTNAVPVVTHIGSAEALKEYLTAPDDRVTVISFHASWCKSCQKFGRLYQKLAVDRADWVLGGKHMKKNKDSLQEVLTTGSTRLASIEWGANTDLCRSLGVKRLPSVHYYKNGRKLAGFPAGPSTFQLVKDRLTYYQSLSEEELDFEMKLEQGSALILNTMNDITAALPEITTTSSTMPPRTSPKALKQKRNLFQKIFRRKTV